MKITTLIENTIVDNIPGIKPEHGVALLIESGSHTFLADTGASSLLFRNAEVLKADMTKIDFAVISHGHFDHSGGIRLFLEMNPEAKVYLKEKAFDKYYINIFGFFKKYIGIDQALLRDYRESFIFTDEFSEIAENIFIIPDVLINHPKPRGNAKLCAVADKKLIPDDFSHELILVIKEEDGNVVFTGCSHNGILNMIETVEKYFPGETIKAVIGGFHLHNPIKNTMAEKEESVKALGKQLAEKSNLLKVYTGHCTGIPAYSILKSQMGDKLEDFPAGSSFLL